ncbi:MAG: hypothetical protein AB2799_06045, partial [Candidatus Thiodiazotropha sp.]
SQWDRVELDSVDYNDDPTNIQFNASTGEVVIPASSGYSRMRISGFFTNDSNADGVYAIGFQRNGVAQHNRMVGNTAIDSTAGAAFPLQSFTSPWLPINAGGESLFLQLFNPTSTQLQGVYAMGLGIELKQ